MKLESFKKFKIPKKSGVYFFKKGKEILYIGKATSLSDRVKSYFGKDVIETRGPLILDMVFQSDNIDWQNTDSVLEALILEASLIKKYQPKYNTKEKSDKSFNYICITKEKLPKVIIVRGKNLKEGDKVFGPYPNATQLRDALKIVRKIFPFLDDKSKNYLEFYRQIDLVPDLNDTEMYMQNIRNLKLFFAGKKKEILRNLKKEMQIYAKKKLFEKANEIKRQIFALQHINDIALLKSESSVYSGISNFRIEAYDVAHMGGKNMVGVMTVIENNIVVKAEYKKFKIRTQTGSNDTGALIEILERRFAHKEWVYPNLVVVDGSTAQINAAEGVLSKLNIPISLVAVTKDDRHKMKEIKGDSVIIKKYKNQILLANSEAHRFAISYHKNMRAKNFLA